MMDAKKRLMDMLGLKEEDFKKKKDNKDERIEILEDAFAELCEVVFSGEREDEDNG